jgi:cyclic beta-1,2-glucan synthetase
MTDKVLRQFKKNIHNITRYRKKLLVKYQKNERIGSINEWIIDNYYLINEESKYIQGFYKNKIKSKRKKHVYFVVSKILNEKDYNLDIDVFFNELNLYQQQNKDNFSYAEINYIYIIIRMILIDGLSKLSSKLERRLNIKNEIEELFNYILKRYEKDSNINIDDYIIIDKSILNNPYYVEQLNYKLKEYGELTEKAEFKLNELFLENNMSLKDMIKDSHSETAKDNFLIMNIFNSLKKALKYKIEFFYKKISNTEKLLISEKATIYDNMYDNNKDKYRHQIIKDSKKRGISEYEYTKEKVDLANKEGKHVGWFLFKEKNYKLRARLYVFGVVFFTLILSLIGAYFLGYGMFFLLLIPMSVVVIESINHLLMYTHRDNNSLFKLKFEEGLPEEYSTMIVIPTILQDTNKVLAMFDNLESYYLSNKTENLYFTLLGDCTSEMVEATDKDKEIITTGLNKVAELNEKYGKKLFYFVYRRRFYNESEESFLGFERKRGALLHFNKLILNKLSKEEKDKYFRCQTFDNFNIPIKYVITLDADTKVVLNTALKLIGAMAHPMNRPVLSEDGKSVVSGYAIMQPRISVDVPVTNKSKYSQLFAGLGGLDIYVRASFDLYQNVFNEGSFTGKGIYDLEVFDKILDGRFPNNLILSHDLLEGNYLRCGFVNDIELFDDYPAGYLKDATRHHRWNRGDWQIISWLKRKVKNQKGEKERNPISFLGKWKIFDNLRRSLVSLSLLLIIFYSFVFGKVNPMYYFGLVLVVIALPIFFYLFSRFLYRNKRDFFLKYYLSLIRGFLAVLNKAFILLIILPYESYLYVDSIIRSLYRMFISHKKLLAWVEATEVEKKLKEDIDSYIISFKPNYICVLLLLILCFIFSIGNILLALIIGTLWLLAPMIMHYVSKPLVVKKPTLNEAEKQEVKDIALRTWKFFSDFINEETNYLMPDNYQYNRLNKTDYKTSPSNIGYSLTSVICAAELNFITKKHALNLIRNIISSVEKLEKWQGHLFNWYDTYTLKKLPNYFVSTVDNGNFVAALYVVKGFLEKYGDKSLIYKVEKIIDEMDFSKLYNEDLDVFSIGYNYNEQTLLNYHYNNFASEARLTSFIAIAKGDVPHRHWFCLDKTLTKYKGYKGVVSWSGTAFEYFMPLIFTKTYKHTLLDETYYFAYFVNKEYIRKIDKNLPWGMSESAYNELDDSQNYKYQAFGVPYLMLREDPMHPIVISPYSSLMAISIDEKEIYENIKKLKKLGMYSDYGFYEAYDHDDKTVIKNHYAHHQGMILASLTNYLKDDVIKNYFHSDKRIQSVEMLLKEKVQIEIYIDKKLEEYKKVRETKEIIESDIREFNNINDLPEYGILSNGFYSVIINDRGVGFSKYKNLQINRYRMITDEDYGIFMYIRNLNNGHLWTNTYAPLNAKNNNYRIIFASDRIKYVREDKGIITTTEITVVKDHTAEIRKVTFTNNTNEDVTLEVTSYGEVIMCRNEEDIAHRTFNGLTIESEADKDTSSLIFTRSSKTKVNTTYYIINRLFTDKKDNNPFEFETSRTKFIGRGRTARNPKVIMGNEPLSNTIGASIDPIMSIRKKITVKKKSSEKIYLLVGFGKSKEQVMEIVSTYKDDFSISKAFDLTTVYNSMLTSYGNITANQKRLYSELLKYICNAFPLSNEKKELLEKNMLPKSTIYKYGISGNLPIIFVEISNIEDVGFISEVLSIYEFFKSRTLYIDVIILIDEVAKKEAYILNYINKLMYHINNLNYFENTLGDVYILSSGNVNPDEKRFLKLLSSVCFNASINKSLEEQIRDLKTEIPIINKLILQKPKDGIKIELPQDIKYYNQYGGFINNGREYLITTIDTPMPWVNVITSSSFGTIVSSNLGSFSFAQNSREFKITSWTNDITTDQSSERLIIDNTPFIPSYIRHGFGYSILYKETGDYSIFIKIYVSTTDTIKFYEINIYNKSKTSKAMKFDFVFNPVLGVSEEYTNKYIVSEFDTSKNALYFKNVCSDNFYNTRVFVSASEIISAYNDKDVNNKSITVSLNLDSKEKKTFCFMLGTENNEEVLSKYQNVEVIMSEFTKVNNIWQEKIGKIVVNTPDDAFNYVLNGWYLYQVYASRLLAKAGFYQVGGATGFRDQLQDVMALLYTNPSFARNQILKHANHQFKEGDVLHWWHEEIRFGARTKFSDDYLWLPYVTYEYLNITRDYSILDEKLGFVTAEKLSKNEDEKGVYYDYIDEEVPLYEHLKLCINKALNQFGKHGIPLMGSGDWNDGMNKVGSQGCGESVFVGFFLYDILLKMSEIAKRLEDKEFVDICLSRRDKLQKALQKNCWDGAWYLRAFFDNGDSLGSRNNSECQIDLLSQSWSIISNLCDDQSKKDSLFKEIEERLVDSENGLIKLLTPPFKYSKNNPGYIKDYVPGIRENGGQYTHAALWYILALLKENKKDQAYNYYQMINPINKTKDSDRVEKYKTEPYVIAADIYSHPEALGRGGWTWYTGSAAWAYKIGIEEILGLKKIGNSLSVEPKVPSNWDGFEIVYTHHETRYFIKANLNAKANEIILDGKKVDGKVIELEDDKEDHNMIVNIKEGL